jgi:general stress protein 26
MNDENTASRGKLWKMIKDIRFAMLTTRHGNGHLHARPMTTQNTELGTDDSLWFFMSRKGDPVGDLAAEPMVGVAYADPSSDTYVSVCGTAAAVDDPARKKELWSKLADAWFPGGPGDPDLALVQVRILHAAYWDVKESKLVQLYAMTKAALTGTPPTKLGEHGEVRLR